MRRRRSGSIARHIVLNRQYFLNMDSGRQGNCYVLFWRLGKGPVIVVGPHCESYIGPYAVMMLGVIGLLNGLFIGKAVTSGVWIAYIQAGLLTSTLLFYLWTILANPGIQLPTASPFLSQSYCNVCRCFQTSTTEHCGVCEICVQDWDHHCPWVGKCIGQGNKIAFYLWIAAMLCTTLVLFIGNPKTNELNPAQIV